MDAQNNNNSDELVVEDPNNCNTSSNDNDNDENDNSTYKFSSPEAGAERLGKLPPNILSTLRSVNEEIIFDAFIVELKNRCHEHKNKLEKYSPERMWTQIVFSKCMNFRYQHFHSKPNSLENIPNDFLHFLRDSTIVNILQILVDVAQQSGFNAKQLLDGYNTDTTFNVNQKDYNDARERWNTCQRHYYDYVELFRHCTGMWRPNKNRQSDSTNRNSSEPKKVFDKKFSQAKINNPNKIQGNRPNYNRQNGTVNDRQIDTVHSRQSLTNTNNKRNYPMQNACTQPAENFQTRNYQNKTPYLMRTNDPCNSNTHTPHNFNVKIMTNENNNGRKQYTPGSYHNNNQQNNSGQNSDGGFRSGGRINYIKKSD
jgi:hypothetical protein